MQSWLRNYATTAAIAATVLTGACGGHKDNAATSSNGDVNTPAATTPMASNPAPYSAPADTAPAKHHSKLAGALVGAAAGHALGGHAVLGAAAGALAQHERNKHGK